MQQTREELIKDFWSEYGSMMNEYGWLLSQLSTETLRKIAKKAEYDERHQAMADALISEAQEQVVNDSFDSLAEYNLLESYMNKLGITDLCKKTGMPIFVYQHDDNTLVLIEETIFDKCYVSAVQELYSKGIRFKFY